MQPKPTKLKLFNFYVSCSSADLAAFFAAVLIVALVAA
jgi:hypothetical protein